MYTITKNNIITSKKLSPNIICIPSDKFYVSTQRHITDSIRIPPLLKGKGNGNGMERKGNKRDGKEPGKEDKGKGKEGKEREGKKKIKGRNRGGECRERDGRGG